MFLDSPVDKISNLCTNVFLNRSDRLFRNVLFGLARKRRGNDGTVEDDRQCDDCHGE